MKIGKKIFLAVLAGCAISALGAVSCPHTSAVEDNRNTQRPIVNPNSPTDTDLKKRYTWDELITLSRPRLHPEHVTMPTSLKEITLKRALAELITVKEFTCQTPNLEYWEEEVFADCIALRRFVIPPKISFLANGLFLNCIKLKEISIPGNVRTIGKHTFKNCGLKSVIMSEGLEKIDEFAFKNCMRLERININNDLPKSVRIIEKGAFADTDRLNNLTISGDGTVIDINAFINKKVDPRKELITVRIPRSTIWKINTYHWLKVSTTDPREQNLKQNESFTNNQIIDYLTNFNVKIELIDSVPTSTPGTTTASSSK